jgi:hypothetical protein
MGSPVSSTNKTDSHDINEILLKVALNTITIILPRYTLYCILTTLPRLVVTAGGIKIE